LPSAVAPQFIGEAADNTFGVGLQLALPDGHDGPASCFKRGTVARIAADIAVELLLPELTSSRWRGRVPATGMSVPEASVNKDSGPVFRQDDIRATGELLRMKAEPEACTVQQRS
jgi:hypothetical protein